MTGKYGEVYRWVGPMAVTVMFVRDWDPHDKWTGTWVGVTIDGALDSRCPVVESGFLPLDTTTDRGGHWERVDAK
jgi:hypothetical protein